jgi:hypothetical protein
MVQNGKKPLLVIEAHCSQFVTPLKKALEDASLWSFESFDLRSARAMHADCACPHHNTSECSCELVILLVYPSSGSPVHLMLDGRDGVTFVYLIDEFENSQRSAFIETVQNAIQAAILMV